MSALQFRIHGLLRYNQSARSAHFSLLVSCFVLGHTAGARPIRTVSLPGWRGRSFIHIVMHWTDRSAAESRRSKMHCQVACCVGPGLGCFGALSADVLWRRWASGRRPSRQMARLPMPAFPRLVACRCHASVAPLDAPLGFIVKQSTCAGGAVAGQGGEQVFPHRRPTHTMTQAVASDPTHTHKLQDRQSVGPRPIVHEFSGHRLRRLLRSMPFAAHLSHSSRVCAAGATLWTCASPALFRPRQAFLNMKCRRCVQPAALGQLFAETSRPQGRANLAVGSQCAGV